MMIIKLKHLKTHVCKDNCVKNAKVSSNLPERGPL